MSCAERWPVATRPTPYAVAATKIVNVNDAKKFQGELACSTSAVPEMVAGVKKTANRPHFS